MGVEFCQIIFLYLLSWVHGFAFTVCLNGELYWFGDVETTSDFLDKLCCSWDSILFIYSKIQSAGILLRFFFFFHLCSIFCKSLCRICIISFLSILVKFISEAIWAGSFLYGKVFNYKFNYFNRYSAIHVICYFLSELWFVCFQEFAHFMGIAHFKFINIKLFIIFTGYPLMYVESVVMAPLSFLMLLICYSSSPAYSVWLDIYQIVTHLKIMSF